MSISASITLKSRPDTGQVKTGDWLDITGSNFGPAPDIKLFDPVQAVDGQQLRTNTPKVGTYSDVTSNAKAVFDGGECWLPSRDPTQEASTSENRVQLGIDLAPFTQFFWFHRTKARTGRKFPFATAVGQAPDWADANMKPWWFTDANNNNSVDQVVPTYGSSGAQFFGNSSSLSKNGNPADSNFYPRSTDFFVTKPTAFGLYQSGDESSINARDATVNIQRYDDAGLSENTFTCDPFKCKNPPMLEPAVQNSATYTVNLNGTPIPNPYVSSGAATLGQILSGLVSYINSNQSLVFAAINLANTKVEIYTINTANVVAITATANITVTNGFPILGASEYSRLQWMSFTNTPAGGWSNVQMLANWMYLATGANARAAIFIGDAPMLADCKDPKPFFYDLWSSSRIVIDKLGVSGYVHHRHANGTVQNNIKGGIV